MTQYLIAFNDEWVPELTAQDVRERGAAARALIEEMKAAGVFVFSDGGLDGSTVVCSVEPRNGSPVFTDGPYVETKEHVAGFWIIDAPDLDVALALAAEGSKACNRKVEVRPFLGE